MPMLSEASLLNEDNLLFLTDGYKPGHGDQLPANTQADYGYLEPRTGAKYSSVNWFGLQGILSSRFAGQAFTQNDIDEFESLMGDYLGFRPPAVDRWQALFDRTDGVLPITIKAAPEGLSIPVSNVLMSIQNNDFFSDGPSYWLPGIVDSLLMHVWYPTTVCTVSANVRRSLEALVEKTGADKSVVDFMLHDFGFRSVAMPEAGKYGGAAHVVNFLGSDTISAIPFIKNHYAGTGDRPVMLSVPASQHGGMTALGREGEMDQLDKMFDLYPTGIFSCVGDSYDYYNFLSAIADRKDRIMAREGRVVVRPDSTTSQHPTPASLALYTIRYLWEKFGGTQTPKGFNLLDPHIGALWGDGLTPEEIVEICEVLLDAGFAPQNLVFGMGGGLLQKGIDRDTERFALKSSAQMRGLEWHDVQKDPLDHSKKSKAGKLRLIRHDQQITTIREDADLASDEHNLLEDVLVNGVMVRELSFAEVRRNAGFMK